MSSLKILDTGEAVPLSPHFTIGRATANDLVLSSPRVSSQHAAIRWTGVAWEVRDLGSRNGTWLDGVCLTSGDSAALREGALLAFGDNHPALEIVDLSAPLVSARAEDGEWVAADDRVLTLPSPAVPEVTLFESPRGAWLLETIEQVRVARDGERVRAGGRVWRIQLPVPVEGTWGFEPEGPHLSRLALVFQVSRDEEEIRLEARREGETFDLGSRLHHYLLLLLARARIEDSTRPGCPPDEQGWVEVVSLNRSLRWAGNQLNLAVYRARKQLSEIGVLGAGGLVERRPTSRQIRIGISKLEIHQS